MAYQDIVSNPFTIPGTAAGLADFRKKASANGGTPGPVVTVAVPAYAATTPAPTITSFTPTTGAAGTTVTVTGTNLSGATGLTLNGVNIFSSITGNTATSITFTVPAGPATGPITVTTAGGTASSTGSFTVTTAAPATINGGKIILLTGQSQVVGKASTSDLTTLKPTLLNRFSRVFIQSQTKDGSGNYTYGLLQAGVNNYGAEQETPGAGLPAAFGAELELAYQWEANNPTETLLLVKHPISGTFLSQHIKGTAQYASILERMTAAKAKVSALGHTPELLATVFGQGEADANQDENNGYAQINPPGQANPTRRTREVQFLADMRADGVMSTTSRYIIKGVKGMSVFNNDMKAAFASEPLMRYIDTDPYTLLGDGLHYDAPSEVRYGAENYAALYSAAPSTGTPGTGTVGTGNTASVTVEDTNPLLYFQSGVTFVTPNNSTDSGSTSHGLLATDGFIAGTFTGDKFALDHIASSAFLIQYDVYLEGKYRATVSAGGANESVRERFSIGGLGSGSHSFMLVGRADYNAYLYLDRIRLAAGGALVTYAGGTAYPYATAIDDSSSSIAYANGWNSFNEPNGHGGTLHYTGPSDPNLLVAQVPVPAGVTKAHVFAPLWGNSNAAFAQHTRFLVGATLLDELILPSGSETSRERLVLTLPANTTTLLVTNQPGSGKMGMLDYIVFE